VSRIYRFELAKTVTELTAYFDLRRQIFCREQGLFIGSDRDEIDRSAYPIVALAPARHIYEPDLARWERVVGVVRIYETEPGSWYGGRLGVHPDHRRGGSVGRGLIEKAVTTANAWGCRRFLATVQSPNARFFQRLHWKTLEELTILDRPHHLMEADLAYYPPNAEVRPARVPQLLEVV
jgi:putative N-acetyltransferase (TIGR04045 family)